MADTLLRVVVGGFWDNLYVGDSEVLRGTCDVAISFLDSGFPPCDVTHVVYQKDKASVKKFVEDTLRQAGYTYRVWAEDKSLCEEIRVTGSCYQGIAPLMQKLSGGV